MKITTTKGASSSFLDILVYGQSGCGKTRLTATIPSKDVLLINAEDGALSLREFDIDMVQVETYSDVNQVVEGLKKGSKYEWVVLDSISEIAEKCLIAEKENSKDPRQAYGALADVILKLIKDIRALPMNTYTIAKMGDDGAHQKAPLMPGSKLAKALPYEYDEVFAMYSVTDDQGVTGAVFQTQQTPQYAAKDRSGSLERIEVADLSKIVAKIFGGDK